MRTNLTIVSLLVLCLYSCAKKSSTAPCENADAINYQQQAACVYPSAEILEHPNFRLMVTKYPLDPIQVGTTFTLTVTNSLGGTGGSLDSSYKYLELSWNGGGFYPYQYTAELNGFSFTIPDTSRSLYWALAPITGTGTFGSGTFEFTGIVHSSNGDSAIVIQSY